MKDKSMLAFYKTLTCFDSAAYTKRCIWGAEHDEQSGSYSEFISRLRRCYLSQLRLTPATHSRASAARGAIGRVRPLAACQGMQQSANCCLS
jgi:hypothetical protein